MKNQIKREQPYESNYYMIFVARKWFTHLIPAEAGM